MEQTGIDEDGWADIDSQVRREIWKIDKVEKQLGCIKTILNLATRVRSGRAMSERGCVRWSNATSVWLCPSLRNLWVEDGLWIYSRRQHWSYQSS